MPAFPCYPEGVNNVFLSMIMEHFNMKDEALAKCIGVEVITIEEWREGRTPISSPYKYTLYYYFKYLNLA